MANLAVKEREFSNEYPRFVCGELKHQELMEYLGMPETTYRRYKDNCKAKGLIDENYETPIITIDDVNNTITYLENTHHYDNLTVMQFLSEQHKRISAFKKRNILSQFEDDHFTEALHNISICRNSIISKKLNGEAFMQEHKNELLKTLGYMKRILAASGAYNEHIENNRSNSADNNANPICSTSSENTSVQLTSLLPISSDSSWEELFKKYSIFLEDALVGMNLNCDLALDVKVWVRKLKTLIIGRTNGILHTDLQAHVSDLEDLSNKVNKYFETAQKVKKITSAINKEVSQ